MIDAIVLAAGLGTRMGRLKPLIPIEGKPALTVVIEVLREAGIDRPIVVLGREANRVLSAVDLAECRIVVNPEPRRGLSSSLDLGLRLVDPKAIGTLVLHVDMPAVRADTIRSVLDAAEAGAKIAAPTHNGRRGFPVYFSHACFDELTLVLTGDKGARDYIAARRDSVTLVPVDDPGSLLDIDRPEDLAEIERRAQCATSA